MDTWSGSTRSPWIEKKSNSGMLIEIRSGSTRSPWIEKPILFVTITGVFVGLHTEPVD